MCKRIQLNHFVSKPYNVHVHLIQNINTHLNWKYANLLFAFLIAVFLRMYEVLPTEPLHYIKEHISNVVTEIVAHLSDEEKALCEKAVEVVAWTKDQLRGSDYREMSIMLAKQLKGNI